MSYQHYLSLGKDEGFSNKQITFTINGNPLQLTVKKYNSGLCEMLIPENFVVLVGTQTEIPVVLTGQTADILPNAIHLIDCVVEVLGLKICGFLQIDPSTNWKFQLKNIGNMSGTVKNYRQTFRWVVQRDF